MEPSLPEHKLQFTLEAATDQVQQVNVKQENVPEFFGRQAEGQQENARKEEGIAKPPVIILENHQGPKLEQQLMPSIDKLVSKMIKK